jgi:hypothetical protein
MASPANSIPDNQLGLSSADVQALRYHQQAALSHTGSSRAASQASSQGRLLLDPTSLQALSNYFDRLMYSIQQRWTAVSFHRRLDEAEHTPSHSELRRVDASANAVP